MPSHEISTDAEQKMLKTVEVMSGEFRGIRTGRASPALVENIRVEYYGSPTPLKQLANISIPEPRSIIIKPFDISSLKDIEKAIMTSDTGINPNNDGKLIRLFLPPLSEERRKQLSKGAKETAEKAKVSIRNIRRDAIKMVEEEEKKKNLTEDDKFRLKDEVQKLTEKCEKQIEELLTKKTTDIMEI